MIAEAGDVIVYIGAIWHTIGVNRGDSPRVALLGQWSPHYMTPLEATAWMTPSWVLKKLTSETKTMLGINGYTPSSGAAEDPKSRPPHRGEEDRPLGSCLLYAYDAAIEAHAVKIDVAVVASGVAALGLGMMRWRGQVVPSWAASVGKGGLLCAVGGVVGYLVGVVTTIRRLNF